ncbi:MAG: hypothetical protein DFNUSKGM_001888 [Candidatus Fervidibacter sacchari]
MRCCLGRLHLSFAVSAAFVATLVVIFAGCGGGGGTGANNPSTPTRGTTVLVQDAFSGAPVPNASIRIGSQNFTTNNNGSVNASLPTGSYQLEVSKSGYVTFQTQVACFDGAQIQVKLTPNLSPVTEETFQQFSEQAFAAVEGLRDAITAVQTANENTTQNVLALFESSSNAFVATLGNFGKLSPTKIGRSRGLLDFLSNWLSVTKVAQNTEQMRQLKQRLLNGEDVPEIDAWLANHPFQGARSVRELREMYPGAEEPMLERLFAVYQTQNPSSNFNRAMDGAKDIWTSQFPSIWEGPKNLIGWAIDKVWNGAGKVIITTYDYAKLVLEGKEQIAWLWDKAKSQLILAKVKNNEPVTLPQSTFDIVISNGKAHRPTIVTDYQINSGTQTLAITPEPISITPIGFNAYVGQFSATFDETNNLGTCRFTVNLSIKVEVPTDGSQTGNMIVNGTWSAQVIALAPGVTNIEPSSGTYTFQNVKDEVEIVYDPNSRPIVVQGSLMNTWSNAAAGVGIVGEISGSRINADVVFVPRFGPFMPTHTKSVTLNRQ